jgi:hypothetical protein
MKHEVFGYILEQKEKPVSISAPIEEAKFNEVKKSQDTEFLKLYDALHAKNSKVIDIRRSFASNALHKN